MIGGQLISEEQAVNVVHQIFEGLHFLHGISIVHRDIKPENILKQITREGKELYKITDFGLSSTKDSLLGTAKIGTAYYVAPEVIEGKNYDKTVDIWAAGLVLDELLHGTPFYNGSTEEEVLRKIQQESYFIRNKEYRDATIFDGRKHVIQQILLQTIQRDSLKRQTVTWVMDQFDEYKQQALSKTNRQMFSEDSNDLLDLIQNQSEQKFQNIEQPIRKQWEQPKVCQEHSLPLKFRYPGNNNSLLSGCQKCLQKMGVFELDSINKMVTDTLTEISKGIKPFFPEIQIKLKIYMEQMSNGNEFDIKENGQMTEQYNLICIKWENEAKSKSGEIQEYLMDIKERGFVGNDEKLLLNWLMANQNGIEDNKILFGYQQQMDSYRQEAYTQCRNLLQEQLNQMIESLLAKIDKL